MSEYEANEDEDVIDSGRFNGIATRKVTIAEWVDRDTECASDGIESLRVCVDCNGTMISRNGASGT